MFVLASLAAHAATPDTLHLRVGLAPAELAHIEVPAQPGTTTHHITYSVEFDATVNVWQGESGLELTVALMPTTRRVKGVEAHVAEVLQLTVERGTWPLAVGRGAMAYPEPGLSSELFQGGEHVDDEGTRTLYGVMVILGEPPKKAS